MEEKILKVLKNRDSKGKIMISARIHRNREVAEIMAVHIYGDVPTEMIERRRPNEGEDVFEYRKANYQPITQTLTGRAIDKIHRIFSSTGLKITTTGILESFLIDNDFKGQPFINWVQKDLIKTGIADPNAWLVWMPTGKGIETPTEKVVPKPFIINSEFQLYIDSELIVWESDNGNDNYWAMDKENIYIITEDKKEGEYKYTIDIYYNHKIGYIPFSELGGVGTQKIIKDKKKKEKIKIEYYESFFNTFVPFANDFINQYEDCKAIMVTSAFPIPEIEAMECKSCNGQGHHKDKDGDSHKCLQCNGTGEVGILSPFGKVVRKRATALDTDTGNSSQPAFQYHSPDSAIIQVNKDSWMNFYDICLKALYLNDVPEAQSGIAKMYDRDDYNALLSLILNNTADLIYNSLYYIDRYINLSGESVIDIEKPVSFAIESESDLITKIKMLKDSGVNPFIIAEAELSLLRKTAPNNEVLKVRTMLYNEFYGSDDLIKAIIESTSNDEDFDTAKEKINQLNINLKSKTDGTTEEVAQ
jgi:hypothetical protein